MWVVVILSLALPFLILKLDEARKEHMEDGVAPSNKFLTVAI